MSRVLQVDVSGRPIGLIPWHRAVNLIWQDRATAFLEDGTRVISSPSLDFPYPIIVQTHSYVKLRPLRDNQIVKRVLFARDNYECQYCGKEVTLSTGTVDHVKPRARFLYEGLPAARAHTWDNVVVSCVKCNTKKGSRLPYECGMMPKNSPKKPNYVMTIWAGKVRNPIHAKYIAEWYNVDPETLIARRGISS